MYNVMVVERRNKYSSKTLIEPKKFESFNDLTAASACMFKLKNFIMKHYDVYITNTHKCEKP